MPSATERNRLKKGLEDALLRATQHSAREIIQENDIEITEEQIEQAEPSQRIDAREKSKAITDEVTVFLLERIEQLENRVNDLETRLTRLNTTVGSLSTTTTS